MRIKPVVIVIFLILLAVVTYIYIKEGNNGQVEPYTLTDEEKKELAEFEMQIRRDSLDFVNSHKYKYHNSSSHRDYYPTERFPFDPNTADSITFLRLGLKPWQAHNALQYRRHNGRWRKPEAFLKLYGLTEEQGKELLPYIQIKKNAEELLWEEQKVRRDSLRATFPQKLSPGTIISLNNADTTILKRIPGIGSYYASKIVRYRERLGGFVDVLQLKEIDGLPPKIENWFEIVKPAKIKKIKINHSDFKTLVRHPYLNYEQVKVITNHIRLHGPINDFNDLKLSKDFSDKDFERLRPYIDFK